MKRPLCLTLCLLTVLVACGGDPDHKEDEKQRQDEVNQETQGFYETSLIPLNTGIAGSTIGHFSVKIYGDQVTVKGNVQNSPKGIHRQFIHTGGNCPGPGADLNVDGAINFDESVNITGPAFLPLDQNLSTQSAGFVFPVGNSVGNYSYAETTSLVRMLADLHSADPNPNDSLVKLAPDEGLNLAGRTIVIYGAHGVTDLPIACGTLVRSIEPLPENPQPLPVPPPHRPIPHPPLPRVPADNEFSTMISHDLTISGIKCSGVETTEAGFVCQLNQWLVTVDRADEDDAPFVANLVFNRSVSTPVVGYYNIAPVSPVDTETFFISRQYWVKFTPDQEPIVLKKPQL